MQTSLNREGETVEMVKLPQEKMSKTLEMILMIMQMTQMMLHLMIRILKSFFFQNAVCDYDIAHFSELIPFSGILYFFMFTFIIDMLISLS